MRELTVFELLVELMYDGKSGLIEDLVPDEPLDVECIVKELESLLLTGLTYGKDIEGWVFWFSSQTVLGSKDERINIKDMYLFKMEMDQHKSKFGDKLSKS